MPVIGREVLRSHRIRIICEQKAAERAERYAIGVLDGGDPEAAEVVRHVVRTRRIRVLELQGQLAALYASDTAG